GRGLSESQGQSAGQVDRPHYRRVCRSEGHVARSVGQPISIRPERREEWWPPAGPLGRQPGQEADRQLAGGEEIDVLTIDRIIACQRLKPHTRNLAALLNSIYTRHYSTIIYAMSLGCATRGSLGRLGSPRWQSG